MSYIPHTSDDIMEMMRETGIGSVEELFEDIPAAVKLNRTLDLPKALSEVELKHFLGKLAARNASFNEYACFLGAGVYDHFIPSVVHHIISRSEFYTSYTPYQPEISQGMLQAIYEYQTMVCMLTGMDVANASMYDGATALPEAASMITQATRRNEILVAESMHPEYLQVLQTYSRGNGLKITVVRTKDGVIDLEDLEKKLSKDTAGFFLQNPNFWGLVEIDAPELGEMVHQVGGLYLVSADPISLGIMKPPGEYGADIVVGEGQSLGNHVSFGGPLLGLFACSEKLMRRMPGRVVGKTLDKEGNIGYVLTMQAREQHIRRQKAASNICSNEALNTLAAAVYLAVMGKEGIPEVAKQCIQKANYAIDLIRALPGYSIPFSGYIFKEFVVECPNDPNVINKHLLQKKIIGGLPLKKFFPDMQNKMLFCVTEKRSLEEINALVTGLGEFA